MFVCRVADLLKILQPDLTGKRNYVTRWRFRIHLYCVNRTKTDNLLLNFFEGSMKVNSSNHP